MGTLIFKERSERLRKRDHINRNKAIHSLKNISIKSLVFVERKNSEA